MSTTNITDTRTRVISSTSLPWQDVPTPRGALAPDVASATYYGSVTPEGLTRWTVNAYVTGRRRGKSGRRTQDVDTAWFLVTPDQHPDERAAWPLWLVAWLEKYHPGRASSLDLDPEGSYL